ncbi:MAG: hypothetical protein HY673_00475 [Chloroflexi bacterium]|nr:hypothetical protein [Chloroflexota bacterium]
MSESNDSGPAGNFAGPGGRPPDPDKQGWSPFKKGLVATAIPLVAGSIAVPALLLLLDTGGGRMEAMGAVAIMAFLILAAFILGIILSAVLAITGRRQLAAGILAGMGIGIVALGISCFSLSA